VEVEKERIDASIGLAPSLALFERYHKNGLLQAELHHVPGIRGRCNGYLHLVGGKVITCYIEDKVGRRFPIGKDTLCRLDDERGPFEWSLYPLPTPPMPGTALRPEPFLDSNAQAHKPIPKRVAPFGIGKLDGWTMKQRLMLTMVFETIDGQRTIEEIKANVPLLYEVTEEAIRVLLALKLIVID
jgi:hypothetical protein